MLDQRRRAARLTTRISFTLVLLMGLFGWWYATRNWHIDPTSIQLAGLTGEGDWVDFASALGERALQIFLGLTGDGTPPQ